MITVDTRRRDALFRDPAMAVILGLLVVIAYLVIRVTAVDLQNRSFQSGLDLLYADLLRFHPTANGATLLAGVLILQAISAPAIFMVSPQALEIPTATPNRVQALEMSIGRVIGLNLVLTVVLASIYGPLIRLGHFAGTTLWLEDGLGVFLLSLWQALLIGGWIGLWYAPRPARLWQRLGAWLMPIAWTVDLLKYSHLRIGWNFDALGEWLALGFAISLALIVKLRLWEQPAIADDAHP